MREIKFELWEPNCRKIPSGMMWNMLDMPLNLMFDIHNKDKTTILRQYTGLKDMHGKDIYEGDIVKALTDGEEDIFEIKWLEEKEYSGWEIGTHTECEILGNIYENRELLE